MRVDRFEDLVAWQRARELAREVYSATRGKPFADDFGLVRQTQRAAVSIMSNIAEGFGREGAIEFHRFVTVARGSTFELQSHLYLAHDLGYLPADVLRELSARIEVSRLLRALRTSLGKARTRARTMKSDPRR